MLLRRIFLVSLIIFSISCASLRTQNGSINWSILVSDAQFGVAAACDTEVLTKDVCNIVIPSLITLSDSIKGNTVTALHDVNTVLINLEVKFPVTKPYLDWLLVLTGNN